MEYRFRNFHIPGRMQGAIQRYVDNGIRPGRFLEAVICNNLFASVGEADEENLQNLPAYTAYFYNETPSACWGSKEKMEAWIEQQNRENK